MSRFSPGLIGGGLDAFTKILMHFDSSYADAASPARVWTARGTPVLAGTGKFSGSMNCGAQAGYCDTPYDTAFNLGSQDFTVDCWALLTGDPSAACAICGCADTSNVVTTNSLIINRRTNASGGNIQFIVCIGSTAFNLASSAAWPADSAMHHLACVRSGGTQMIFIDGVASGSQAISGTVNVPGGSQVFAVGNNGQFVSTNVKWNGSIDEFRLSVGIARWTSNFTPPTAPYS